MRESSGTSDYRTALRLLAERRAAVARGREVSKLKASNVMFSNAMEKYLAWAKPQRSYMSKVHMSRDLILRFGNIPLRRFNVSMLEAYQQEIIAAGTAPATVNRRMALVKHLVHKCNDWGLIDDDVLQTVRKVKMLKEPPGRLRYLTPEEIHLLLKECTSSHLHAIVTIAVNTGMRRGEILDLTWENVDLRNGYLLVVQSKNGDRREVPINAKVREVLTGIVRRLDSPYVFCDVKDRMFRSGRNAFVRACKRAGIHDFRFHDLRHTAASIMAMAGVDLMSIMKILGHKTFQMTLRYSHLSPGHLRNAVAAIDRALTLPSDPASQFTSQSSESSLPTSDPAGTTARI